MPILLTILPIRELQMKIPAALLFAILVFLGTPANAQEIRVVTEDFPPFQWVEDGELVGPSIDVTRALLQATGTKATIEVYPWARAYKIATTEKNVLLLSPGRNAERENLFKWLGVIMHRNMHLWKLKERQDIVVERLEDAKNYKTAVVRSDVRTQFLLENGFVPHTHLHVVPFNKLVIRLLFKRRADLIMENNGLPFKVEKLGLNFDELEKVLHVPELSGGVYGAFSLKTPDTVVNRFRDALKQLKDEGEFDKIISKYK